MEQENTIVERIVPIILDKWSKIVNENMAHRKQLSLALDKISENIEILTVTLSQEMTDLNKTKVPVVVNKN